MTNRHYSKSSKRRDPDDSDTAPALQPKRDRHPQYSSVGVRPTRNGRGGPRQVKQEREEPLISTGVVAPPRYPRDPVEYAPSGRSRHTISRQSYHPPCPVIAMPLSDGNLSTLTNEREFSRNMNGGKWSQTPSRVEALRQTAGSEEEIMNGRSAESGGPDKEFEDFLRSDSGWDMTRKDEEDARTESTDLSEEDRLNSPEKSRTMSTEATEVTEATNEDTFLLLSKQRCSFVTIFVLTAQLTILLIQLTLCGMAPLDVNPIIGPYPDAFSEWGGKNAYLMLEGHQYFRLITPAFLHVGVLHFVLNALCTLRSAAVFEQEWGSYGWITAYLLSAIGAVATSCVIAPDEIGVASSGALMGLFGAKVAQFIAYTCFDLHTELYLESARSHVIAVLCNASVVFLLCFVTYIDISGHAGGFVTGLFAGMFLFCRAIKSMCTRFLWSLTGFLGLLCGAGCLSYYLLKETNPDEELGDACQYFRNLYQEGYDCECNWA